ncbi:hypothetical protein V5O48_003116 [Marasmius crinis-equi]|uniref:HTH La-type RNA-binding domain-containing protein n=1 Tax=Marasmius crinis-equi TaxID=585013 RepID=A0ABR3FTT3_9AGAR
MNVVPTHNVWALRQQQNLKGSSSPSTENQKSNQNTATKSSGSISVGNAADDEAWPQVNINSSKTKEKTREKLILSPSSTTNGIVGDSSPRKGDKTKPKWVPMTLTESSGTSSVKNNRGSSSASTSNTASPRHKSPVVLPIPSTVDTSAADNSVQDQIEPADSLNRHLLVEAKGQNSAPASMSTPPLPQAEHPSFSRPSQPPSRSRSPPQNQPVILPNNYPSYSEPPYSYHSQPYPFYDHAAGYSLNPYHASSSSHTTQFPYTSESLPFLPGQASVRASQAYGVESFPFATSFGDVELGNEKRRPPFAVGTVDRKGKGKDLDLPSTKGTRRRRRRKSLPFAVGSWRSSSRDEIIDLTSTEDSQSAEHDNSSQRRTKRRWVFFWDGTHLVNVLRYHPAPHHFQQQNYDPRYPYPYYQQPHPVQSYPLPYQPAPPMHYTSVYHPQPIPYSHPHSHPHPQHVPSQSLSAFPPYMVAQAPQPTYAYPQPTFEGEGVKETPDNGNETGIPIPNASTTTILVSASPNNTESDSVTSNTSSASPTHTNSNLRIPSSHSSTTATSFQDDSDSDNKLPPLSALPTLNNLPTLGSLPTPLEGSNKLSPDPTAPSRHSPRNPALNPAQDPFIPSNPPPQPSLPINVEEVHDRFHQEDEVNVFEVRYPIHTRPITNGWNPGEGIPVQDERLAEYPGQDPKFDEMRYRRERDPDFQRGGGYRANGDWRGTRPFRARGFGMGRGRGRGGFRGRGFGYAGFVPPMRESYEAPMNGITRSGPPRYRHGRTGSYVPPLEMPQYYQPPPPPPQHSHSHPHSMNTSPIHPNLTPPQGYSTSPYASHPGTNHPSPLMSQGTLSLHHTPPGQYHVPAQIPIQTSSMTLVSQHPWPTPLTPLANIPVMLDEVRHRLLGQLEYYLSGENMAKDVWLRRKMSPDGWILLSVIATFNRIRQLTDNLHLLREVLGYSEHVEVSDDGEQVRMRDGGWKSFVLPPSVAVKIKAPPLPPVNGDAGNETGSSSPHVNGDVITPSTAKSELTPTPTGASHPDRESDGDESEVEEDLDSEDEDDVVFVLGSESGGGWSRAASGEREI